MSDRIPQLLEALSTIEPAALRKLGEYLPDHRSLTEALIEVTTRSGADQAQLMEAIWRDVDPPELLDGLRPVLDDASTSLKTLRARLETTSARLIEGKQLRARIEETLVKFSTVAADEPPLRALLTEAEARLTDPDLWRAAEQVQSSASALVNVLQKGLAGSAPRFDSGVLAAHFARLQTAEVALKAAPGRFNEVLLLLVQARDIAEETHHPLRASLALVVARLSEGLTPSHEQAQVWRITLDRALSASHLPIAQIAGRRVQANALAQGDHRVAGLVSHRIAELARETGALEVEVIARLEQALAAAREPKFAERARALADDAMIGAQAVGGPVLARAQLMYGQLLEHLADGEGARDVLRRLMRQAKKAPDEVGQEILGRAAFTLGTSEARVGHWARARQNLELALELATTRQDYRLYDAALPALLELLDAVDQPAAIKLFTDAEALFGGQAARLRTRLAGHFGAATVGRWIAG